MKKRCQLGHPRMLSVIGFLFHGKGDVGVLFVNEIKER